MLSAARDTLAPVLIRAEDMGVTFVLENIEDIEPADRARLCAALDWQALALSVDTGHAHYAHGSTGGPPVDYFIRDAGTKLAHVHLQDADGFGRSAMVQSCGPGCLRPLRKPGPTRARSLSCPKAGMIPSARYLQSLGLAE